MRWLSSPGSWCAFLRSIRPAKPMNPARRHLGNRLKRAGFEVTYVRAEGAIGDSERYPRVNVVARNEGRGSGPCVHFNGHIDVVEAAQGWTVDPFAGVVQGGRLYGRGACDMKGGIAAAVIALESIWPRAPGLRARSRFPARSMRNRAATPGSHTSPSAVTSPGRGSTT